MPNEMQSFADFWSSGPGPQNPWGINGSTLFFDAGGVTIPFSVPGGTKGPGSLNVNALYVQGVPVKPFSGSLTTGEIPFGAPDGSITTDPAFTWDDVNNVLHAPRVVITAGTGAGSIGDLALTATGAGGVNFKMTGDGAVTPSKTFRVNGGHLQVLTDAGAALLDLSEIGALSVGPGVVIPAAGTQDIGLLFSSTAHFGLTYAGGAPTISMARGTMALNNGAGGMPYVNTDGTPTGWVQVAPAVGGGYLPLSGGAMTGPITASMTPQAMLNLVSSFAGSAYARFANSTNNQTYIDTELSSVANAYCFWGIEYNGGTPRAVISPGVGVTGGLFVMAPIVSTGAGSFAGNVSLETGVAVPAGGTQDVGVMWSNTAHLGIVFGSGLPNKVQARGTWYQRVDSNASIPPLYYNIDGTATGWIPFSSGGTVAVGTTPPVAPADNSLWFYTDSVNGGGTLYIRYNDGNSTQWVPASPAPASSAVPPGSVVDFAGAAAPAGWLFANGQTVSRTLFSALFAAIGIAYGAGDGSTTFQLPDLCGRVTGGLDNMGNIAAKGRLTSTTMTPNATTLGATGGSETVALTVAQMPAHGHLSVGLVGNNLTNGTTRAVGTADGVNSGYFQDVQPNGTTGGNGGHANVAPVLLMNKIIKI
jgi:microcystin-dependent protein